MTTIARYARTSALPAIAAALALSSTTALAQPVPAETTPPETTATPATSDSSTATDSSTTTETTTTAPTTTAAKPKVTRTTRTVVKRTTPATATAARTVSRTTRQVASSAPTKTVPAPAPAAPVAVPASRPAPVVDLTAKPAPPAPLAVAAKPSDTGNETAIELGGGALALLALGAGALALSRRRRRIREDEWASDDMAQHDHVEPAAVTNPTPEPAMAAPRHDPIHQAGFVAPAVSAFAWGNSATRESQVEHSDDRREGESWVDRAYRGPSADNPSLSLRKRLKRAAFFDKRDREVAAGHAAPVEADAGLPETMVEERELETA